MTGLTVICCAHPFGYGPAVKLVLVASRLRAAGLHTVFLGHGIAHEMAVAGEAFDEVIHARPADPRAARRMEGAEGLFSMMDREFASIAVAVGKPLYVADSLHWMRDDLPVPFAEAERYWVQKFVATGCSPLAGSTPVGPIVEPRRPTPEHLRGGLVVNLGGCETPAGPTAEDFAYGEFVMRGLLDSGVGEAFAGEVDLISGSSTAAHLHAAFPDAAIRIRAVAHEVALDLFGKAAGVLTSPGLTATLECFQFAVPTFFLPPQNYSQWRILDHLRDAGLAPGAFGWPEAVGERPAFGAVPEGGRTAIVRRIISEVSGAESADRMFANSLRQWAVADRAATARRQREFFESLGSNGVETIASELVRAFGGSGDFVAPTDGVIAGKVWA